MRISDWSSDVCSSDLHPVAIGETEIEQHKFGSAGGEMTCRLLRRGRFANLVAGADERTAHQPADCRLVIDDEQPCALCHASPCRGEKVGRASWREQVCQSG